MIVKILLVCLDTLRMAFSYMSSSFYTSNFHLQKLVPFITYSPKFFSCGSDPWRLGQQCGCVLVGHSFGGLVIKSLVVMAKRKALSSRVTNFLEEQEVASAKRFLQNLRGVVNYAVPHNGSFLESYFTLGHNLFRRVQLAEFMKDLRPFSARMDKLSVEFEEISHEKSIHVLAFLEDKPLKDLVSNDFLC